MEEEREEADGNRNGVLFAVAVKTDVEIIVGNLLRQILAACSLFLRWSATIVCEVRLQASVSRSAKRKLESLCTLQNSQEKLRIDGSLYIDVPHDKGYIIEMLRNTNV